MLLESFDRLFDLFTLDKPGRIGGFMACQPSPPRATYPPRNMTLLKDY